MPEDPTSEHLNAKGPSLSSKGGKWTPPTKSNICHPELGDQADGHSAAPIIAVRVWVGPWQILGGRAPIKSQVQTMVTFDVGGRIQ